MAGKGLAAISEQQINGEIHDDNSLRISSAEQSLLGQIFFVARREGDLVAAQARALAETSAIIATADFGHPPHQALFETMLALSAGKAGPAITLPRGTGT